MKFQPLPNDNTPAWPTSHLQSPPTKTLVQKALSTLHTPKPTAVLLSTGAYSPIHLGHVLILEKAKHTLEAQGWNVVGGYISPSHDFYVGPKALSTRSTFANASHRVAMSELATEHLSWLAVGKWEARSATHWPDYVEVARELSNVLNSSDSPIQPSTVKVFYVCGSDHANRCGLRGFRNNEFGLAVVARDGVSIANKTNPNKCVYWCESVGPLATASSTRVRKALQDNNMQVLTPLVHPKVLEYMVDHGLYGATAKVPLPPAAVATPAGETKGATLPSPTASPTQDVDDDDFPLDFSDAVDGLHASWVEEGHNEAISGLEGTDVDAMKLGIHHGTQLGYELGYMRGVLDVLSAALFSSLSVELSERCQRTIRGVQQQLETFPIDQPASEDFQLRLDQMRADFRKCCSQSKFKGVHNAWKITIANQVHSIKSAEF